MSYFYSKREEHKASPACIRFFIEKAIQDKILYQKILENPDSYCGLMITYAHRDCDLSIKELAHKSLEYVQHRAFLGCVYGFWPIDKPAYELWKELNK